MHEGCCLPQLSQNVHARLDHLTRPASSKTAADSVTSSSAKSASGPVVANDRQARPGRQGHQRRLSQHYGARTRLWLRTNRLLISFVGQGKNGLPRHTLLITLRSPRFLLSLYTPTRLQLILLIDFGRPLIQPHRKTTSVVLYLSQITAFFSPRKPHFHHINQNALRSDRRRPCWRCCRLARLGPACVRR